MSRKNTELDDRLEEIAVLESGLKSWEGVKNAKVQALFETRIRVVQAEITQLLLQERIKNATK